MGKYKKLYNELLEQNKALLDKIKGKDDTIRSDLDTIVCLKNQQIQIKWKYIGTLILLLIQLEYFRVYNYNKYTKLCGDVVLATLDYNEGDLNFNVDNRIPLHNMIIQLYDNLDEKEKIGIQVFIEKTNESINKWVEKRKEDLATIERCPYEYYMSHLDLFTDSNNKATTDINISELNSKVEKMKKNIKQVGKDANIYEDVWEGAYRTHHREGFIDSPIMINLEYFDIDRLVPSAIEDPQTFDAFCKNHSIEIYKGEKRITWWVENELLPQIEPLKEEKQNKKNTETEKDEK